mmetsp:Transcript_44711/g.123929  ORF Transcript_44711/g.123929 Transcript_44711/m.123929 type:complete len:335 (-) Transcript_44711:1260-2264(-)
MADSGACRLGLWSHLWHGRAELLPRRLAQRGSHAQQRRLHPGPVFLCARSGRIETLRLPLLCPGGGRCRFFHGYNYQGFFRGVSQERRFLAERASLRRRGAVPLGPRLAPFGSFLRYFTDARTNSVATDLEARQPHTHGTDARAVSIPTWDSGPSDVGGRDALPRVGRRARGRRVARSGTIGSDLAPQAAEESRRQVVLQVVGCCGPHGADRRIDQHTDDLRVPLVDFARSIEDLGESRALHAVGSRWHWLTRRCFLKRWTLPSRSLHGHRLLGASEERSEAPPAFQARVPRRRPSRGGERSVRHPWFVVERGRRPALASCAPFRRGGGRLGPQ